jgi:hypothetical protein
MAVYTGCRSLYWTLGVSALNTDVSKARASFIFSVDQSVDCFTLEIKTPRLLRNVDSLPIHTQQQSTRRQITQRRCANPRYCSNIYPFIRFNAFLQECWVWDKLCNQQLVLMLRHSEAQESNVNLQTWLNLPKIIHNEVVTYTGCSSKTSWTCSTGHME